MASLLFCCGLLILNAKTEPAWGWTIQGYEYQEAMDHQGPCWRLLNTLMNKHWLIAQVTMSSTVVLVKEGCITDSPKISSSAHFKNACWVSAIHWTPCQAFRIYQEAKEIPWPSRVLRSVLYSAFDIVNSIGHWVHVMTGRPWASSSGFRLTFSWSASTGNRSSCFLYLSEWEGCLESSNTTISLMITFFC